MCDNLKLKSVKELLDESFFIPSYQRGYRWTKQQVEDLLNDIWDFTQDVRQDKNKGFYCLQPIVVKESKEDNFKWDVIDGQQRLTTLFIILKYSIDILPRMIKKIYPLGYKTRLQSRDYLENRLEENDETNIDFFHMHKAYLTIKEWFESKDGMVQYQFIERLLDYNIQEGIDVSKNIRVIWYELNEDEQSKDIEIFTRINMGKIPLTNAELVKALLLEGFNKDKQFELASQWDNIEYSLQNNDFWLFINKELNTKVTRIEFIFELIAHNYLIGDNEHIISFKETLNPKIDVYYVFHIINHMLNFDYRDEEMKLKININEYIWSKVNDYFRILNEWYENRDLFHKIGFLITQGAKEHTILNFISKYKKYNKTIFIKCLNREIRSLFKKIEISKLSYAENKDHDKIKKTLLMFNIQTILNNKDSNMKFQFDRFKNDNWDIEHIRSQKDKYPDKKEKEKWIDDMLSFDTSIIQSKDEILEMKDEEYKIFYNEMYDKLEKDSGEDFDKHSIGNLALLDAKTNRSYGNAFFQIKRKSILDNDMNGTFVPICTKNVFMKYYTENIQHIKVWDYYDALNYEEKIIEVLAPYIKGDE